MQAQQQPVMQQQAGVAPTPPAQSQAQQSKEFNTASLCRIGQETVQDIVSRTQEVFQTLKAIQVCGFSRHCSWNFITFPTAEWYSAIFQRQQREKGEGSGATAHYTSAVQAPSFDLREVQ